MSTLELLARLRALDVRLWEEDGRLRYSAPTGVLRPALREELATRKAEIITFLHDIEPIPKAARDRPIPLSSHQENLWLIDRLLPDKALYNMAAALRLLGPLLRPALERSLAEIVRRHEALRTNFVDEEGRPYQVIRASQNDVLRALDLRTLAPDERVRACAIFAETEARRPFDLTRGPLLRATLVTLAEEEHVLVIVVHHIVSDGWSIARLQHELSALYQAFSQGQPSPLPELPIQYADYAVWQRAELQSGRFEPQLDYWRSKLREPLPKLRLTPDRPRPRIQSFEGATLSFSLPQALCTALRDMSRREEVSLFSTLLTAFVTLLHRYTGQDDIVVGTDVSNRDREELGDLMGFFVNQLVLRNDLSGDPTFRTLLVRVHDSVLEDLAHASLPFGVLVADLAKERDASPNPLFQVGFSLYTPHASTPHRFQLSGLSVEEMALDTKMAQLDLALSLTDTETGLMASLQYSTELFDADTMWRLVGHYQALLEAAVADPDRAISDLPMLSAAERHRILVEWNATHGEIDTELDLIDRIERHGERAPDAIAVVSGDESLCYADLLQRTNAMAASLAAWGVRPETLVALLSVRGIDLLVAILAIFKLGGAYLPLDPRHPPARIQQILTQSRVPRVLVSAELFPLMQSATSALAEGARPDILAFEDLSRAPSPRAQWPRAAPNRLAYVIYTSGSTGVPKGAMVEYAGMMNHLEVKCAELDLTAADTVAQTAAQCFDISVWQLLSALLVGGRVHIVADEIVGDPMRLCEELETAEITVLEIVPSLFRAMLDQLEARSMSPTRLRSLRWLLLTGEALPPESSRRWLRHHPMIPIVNAYGPTECSDDVTHYRIERSPASEMTQVPIGKPIKNARLYILDSRLEPVPIGVTGELYIGGLVVGRGYLNQAQKTALAFLPDPFSDEPGQRLYRTGDRARYLPDGTLEFLGRIDHQVKIRGFRVELGEIEATLRQIPGVLDAVVMNETKPDEGDNARLSAYVVVNREHPPHVDEIGRLLSERLPEYELPSQIALLERLPLNENGKVDRRALSASGSPRLVPGSAFVAPRTREEQLLAAIWADFLGLERVGIQDSFFKLGGDSILGIQVIARAERAGLRISLRQLFEHKTIAALASVAESVSVSATMQASVEGPVKLTPIQRWFLEQAPVDPHYWNQALLLKSRVRLDPAQLERAVHALVAHHDALRLRFHQDESGWKQVYADLDQAQTIHWEDLSSLASAEQQRVMEEIAIRLQESFDLTRGPLLGVVCFDRGSDTPLFLLIAIHHLLVDGVSWRILLEDLQQAYGELAVGREVTLPPKTISFQIWAERLSELAHAESMEQAYSFWSRLEHTEMAPLPVDHHTRGAGLAASTRTLTVSLDVDETFALLHEVHDAYGTQIDDLLLTALAQSFSSWTGRRSILVDLERHGREEVFPDLHASRTVGWFTVIFPLFLRLPEGDQAGDALKAVKEQIRTSAQHGLPYGLLRYMRDDAVAKTMHALPQAEVVFNYLGQLDLVLPGAGLFELVVESPGPTRSPRGERRHKLEICGYTTQGRLSFDWSYSEQIHEKSTIERLSLDFIGALRSLIEHCRAPEAGGYTPSDFSLVDLTQDELDELVAQLATGRS